MAGAWQKYYTQLQKDIAQHLSTNAIIEYGEIIYESPVIKNTRWLVTFFRGEYNVFVDKIFENGKFDRCWGEAFVWKDRAVDFALRMFLICSGSIRRKNRRIPYE